MSDETYFFELHDVMKTVILRKQLSLSVVPGESQQQSHQCLYSISILNVSQNLSAQPGQWTMRSLTYKTIVYDLSL